MTWLTWRLQRTELLLLGGLVAVLGGVLSQTRADLNEQTRHFSAEACPAQPTGTELGCVVPVGWLFRIVMEWLPWFNFLPLVAAVLLALPLVGELDHGTHRLAWTQGVTRRRWAGSKLGLLSLGGVAFAAVFAALFRWWSTPLAPNGYLGQDWYDLRGVLPVGHTVLAIGLMLAVGVVWRRPIPALLLASAAFVALRVPFMLWVRPRLLPPKVGPNGSGFADGDWLLSSFWRDGAGNRLGEAQVVDLCPPSFTVGKEAFFACFTSHGLVNVLEYHPASRYWPMQLIETGLYLTAGVALIGFAAWYLLRRVE